MISPRCSPTTTRRTSVSDAVLWVDSDVARSPKKLEGLVKLAQRKGVQVVVPAQVYLERCRQMREKAGESFSPERFDSFIDQLGVEVVAAPLDRARAGAWAELLNRRYPKASDWKRAKLNAVRARLPDEASVDGQEVPMTTDWLTALEVERAGAYVAVEDKGEEWRCLRGMSPPRALTYTEAMQWLSGQADADVPVTNSDA